MTLSIENGKNLQFTIKIRLGRAVVSCLEYKVVGSNPTFVTRYIVLTDMEINVQTKASKISSVFST